MRYKFLSALLMLTIFILEDCTDYISTDSITVATIDESDATEAYISLLLSDFTVNTGSSRAEEPTADIEIASEWEEKIDNIIVFQYDLSTEELLLKPRYYTADESESDGVWTIMLKPDVESKIYVITNVADATSWISNYQKFMTLSGMLNQNLPSPYSLHDMTDEAVEGHIPMQGYTSATFTASTLSTVIEVPVERMYAKIKLRVITDRTIEEYNPMVSNVIVSNSPWYCRIASLYNGDDETSMDSEYTSGEWGSYPIGVDGVGNNTNDPNNDKLKEEGDYTYDFVIYIPENIQGENGNTTKDPDLKGNYAPEHASRMTLDLEFDGENATRAHRYYTVYPGGNNYNNFNIRRNQVYRITLKIGYPLVEDHELSANCEVASPHSTISFEPYYRTEAGGGYDFHDYVNWYEEDKMIKGIKILWQTYECIGDNSKGDLVYFAPSDPQEEHDKLYVTVNEPGNAVIAAYADEDCEGEIIWSWHIWVTSEDPTNIGNAVVYYTYDWDENGIYGEGTGVARVPGYGCMPCNLGALASVPSSNYDQQIFGMNYQWGRKDPFPPLNIGDANHNTGSGCNVYTVETTQQLYDNSHNPTIEMTAEEDATNTKLFRSISGATIKDNPDTYTVKYAIAHPTVFMCGALIAGDVNFDYGDAGGHSYGSSAGYQNNGDWLPESESDNRLWGAIPIEEATKKYTINSSSNIHLYDDYGEKSIFDPCPPGWRVSPPDQWLGFTDDGKTTSSYSAINTPGSNTGYGMYLYIQEYKRGLTSYFPTPGPRIGNGCGFRQYSCGNYHNATADDNNRVNILHIHDTQTNFCLFETNYGYTRKSVAGPIRCVRDTK